MHTFSGKVAVITGGASGIGLAMAERLAAEGTRLVLADIEPGPLAVAAQRLTAAGANVLAVPTDVADAKQMDALAAQTLDHFGAVHIVCNNAGVAVGGPLWDLTTKDWQWILGVNLWGLIHAIRVFVPHLVAQNEGHVVNTASMAGLISVPSLGPYNVTKHGVVTLSETLYGDLAQAGSAVGVSVLCPSFVNTRIFTSDRNRPEALRNPVAPEEEETRPQPPQETEAFFARAMPPSLVAEQVCEAIRQQRFYILTHPESTERLQERPTRLLAGDNPEVIMPPRVR